MLYLKNILLNKKRSSLSSGIDDVCNHKDLIKKSLIKNIDQNKINVIAEIKKASPSKGCLSPDLDIAKTASIYDRHKDLICAISVITEELYFKGSPKYLLSAKNNTSLPVLRKDFILNQSQVYESFEMGADCILLISTLLGSKKLKRLYRLALNLGMDVLVEVHSKKDLEKAFAIDAELIGINNRDLRNMQINKNNIFSVLKDINPDELKSRIFVCESGIGENNMDSEIQYIKDVFERGVHTFLIGSYFMQSPDLEGALNIFKEKLIQRSLI